MIYHIVRLYSYPRSADDVIGRLIYGRRPKGVTAGKNLWGADVHMFDRGVHTVAFRHDHFVVDFHIRRGDQADVEFMVQQIGGKRCRIEVLTMDEWRADLDLKEAEGRDADL